MATKAPDTMEVDIREAGTSDESGLRILRSQAIKATFQETYDRRTVGELVATVDADLGDRIADDRFLVLVAETEITPVSYGVLDRETGDIVSIVTSPDYRREGFASQVFDSLESSARERDHDRIRAVVPDESRTFFEAVGFDAAETDEWHGLDATVFEKRL